MFVTPDRVEFQDTPFPVVALANAFSNESTGTHETFLKVSAGVWVDLGIPGVDFRQVVGDFTVADGTQHGTLVRVQGGMGIPPHFHSLEARGFVL